MLLELHNLFNKLSGQINKKDERGNTALYNAVKAGSLKTVKSLLKEGADPNISNGHRLTPLHQATFWGEVEIVELLLKHGANVNANNGKGLTPLHTAAVSGGMKTRKEIIELLLKHGANPDAPDISGWTPKDYMKLWEENAEAAEKLKQYVAMVGDQDAPSVKKPSTPLKPKH